MRSLSDESLLAGLASSDPDGSAAFVRRFQGRVFGLAAEASAFASEEEGGDLFSSFDLRTIQIVAG